MLLKGAVNSVCNQNIAFIIVIIIVVVVVMTEVVRVVQAIRNFL